MQFAAAAHAQGPAATERISFAVQGAFQSDARVVGELRIPDAARERLPAVLIVNSTPGFDGRGAFYAEALNSAGIATLEVDMFQGKGVPGTPRHNLPHVYQSLAYLARHPRIDGHRIGIMGYSWGGNVALLASFHELAREFGGDRPRFAAHLALYPSCWKHHALLTGKPGKWAELAPTIYRRTTGSPVRILAAGKNDYDDRFTCGVFASALRADVQRGIEVITYPGATFGWDSRFSSATYEASAWDGKGGTVNVVADPAVAELSRASALAYFRKHLAAE